jgi:hypothetical protein
MSKATFYPAYQCAGKPRIRKNAWDNWYGYVGTRRVVMFSNSTTQTQEQQATQWLADMLSEKGGR